MGISKYLHYYILPLPPPILIDDKFNKVDIFRKFMYITSLVYIIKFWYFLQYFVRLMFWCYKCFCKWKISYIKKISFWQCGNCHNWFKSVFFNLTIIHLCLMIPSHQRSLLFCASYLQFSYSMYSFLFFHLLNIDIVFHIVLRLRQGFVFAMKRSISRQIIILQNSGFEHSIPKVHWTFKINVCK